MIDVIVIATVGSPHFLQAQALLLRQYCTTPVEVVVVNDALPHPHPTNWWQADARERIGAVCRANDLREIPFLEHWHVERDYSKRAAETVTFAFRTVAGRAARVAVIDADMFPFRRFSMDSMLEGCAVAGILQRRAHKLLPWLTVRYLWNGLIFFDLRRLDRPELVDFGCGRIRGIRTDTGGNLHHLLRTLPGSSVRLLDHRPSGQWNEATAPPLPAPLAAFAKNDPANANGAFFSEIYCDAFFHFRSGGNWQTMQGEDGGTYRERHALFSRCLAALCDGAEGGAAARG